MRAGRRANIMKLLWALFPINLILFLDSAIFIPQSLSKTLQVPHHSNCICQVIFVWCDIPTVPLEYITSKEIGLSMHSSTVPITNGSYMFQLQSSHHQAIYVRSIKGNYIPAVYIQLKMISGRYISLTYKGIWLLYITNCLQNTSNCIQLNN